MTFQGKLSTIINFKLCKFKVNLWGFVFCVEQKVPKPYKFAFLRVLGFRTRINERKNKFLWTKLT